MATINGTIKGIVFDLDGTLYVAPAFAAAIKEAAVGYISFLQGISCDDARQLMADTRAMLAADDSIVPTLSAVCTALGGNLRDLHAVFEATLRPEAYLVRDERTIALLERLAQRCDLYLYTNNNRALATRIVTYLGIDHCFRRIFTIDETWRAKPDGELVARVLREIGQAPAEVLFVGDRYDVDLRLPEQCGCPVYLTQSVEQLLRLEELLK